MRQGVFANNDCVVNNNPQRQNQTKQADHVDGAAHEQQHAKGCHKRHRDTNGDPPGYPGIEKKEQGGNHQNKTGNAIPH